MSRNFSELTGVNENDPHRLRCLHTWPPLGGAVWAGLGGSPDGRNVSLGEGFEVLKATCHSQVTLSAAVPLPCLLPAAMVDFHPSETVSTNKLFY